MTRVRRVLRALRSRKLAVFLIVLTGAASAIGTAPSLRGWYGHPAFVGLLGVLTASTAACAWERSVQAVRLARDPGVVTESLAVSLRDRPHWAVDESPLDVDGVARALQSAGLRVRRGPSLVAGWSGRLGLVGSPLFHWSLVALFLVIMLGQATRASGLMGVPVGGSVREVAESYGSLQTGPLFPGHTGLTLSVEQWDAEYVVDGVDRGPVPTVSISDGRDVVARQRVYANRPLRVGSLLVHMNDWGLAAQLSVSTTATDDPQTLPVLVDFVEGDRTRTAVSSVEYTDSSGGMWPLGVRLEPGRGVAGSPTVDAVITMSASGGDSAEDVPRRVVPGDTIELPDGAVLTYEGAVPYARLSLVRDWSVWPIYGLLVTATIGLALSLLVPYRAAWVLVRGADDQNRLHVVTRHIRRDPLFAEQVAEVLQCRRNMEGDET